MPRPLPLRRPRGHHPLQPAHAVERKPAAPHSTARTPQQHPSVSARAHQASLQSTHAGLAQHPWSVVEMRFAGSAHGPAQRSTATVAGSGLASARRVWFSPSTIRTCPATSSPGAYSARVLAGSSSQRAAQVAETLPCPAEFPATRTTPPPSVRSSSSALPSSAGWSWLAQAGPAGARQSRKCAAPPSSAQFPSNSSAAPGASV
eukprot:2396198-Rhodomonas_salina.1